MVKYMCTKGSAAEIQTSKHWNLIGSRITPPPPKPLRMLSPSSILPPSLSQCTFFSARKISTQVLKVLSSILFSFLKFRNLKFPKAGNVCNYIFLSVTKPTSACMFQNLQILHPLACLFVIFFISQCTLKTTLRLSYCAELTPVSVSNLTFSFLSHDYNRVHPVQVRHALGQ